MEHSELGAPKSGVQGHFKDFLRTARQFSFARFHPFLVPNFACMVFEILRRSMNDRVPSASVRAGSIESGRVSGRNERADLLRDGSAPTSRAIEILAPAPAGPAALARFALAVRLRLGKDPRRQSGRLLG